jgi:VWFA-related protein
VDATFTGMLLGESDVGRALLIVFSDGLDTSSYLAAERTLDTAKRCDAVAYAVSAGAPRKSEFLDDLTSFTGGRLFEVESAKNLDKVFLEVVEEFRQRYLVSYSPTAVPKDGWHDIQVRVKGRGATVKARRGYLAGGS